MGPRSRSRDPAGKPLRGHALFTDHCAGCHQITAQGGYVTGARVPPLEQATDVEIAEAVRIGPYVMPRFSERAISNSQLDSIIAVSTTRSIRTIRRLGARPDRPGSRRARRVGDRDVALVVSACCSASRRARMMTRSASASGRRAGRHDGAARPSRGELVVLALLGSRARSALAFVAVYAIDGIPDQTQFLGLSLGLALLASPPR